MSRGFWTALPSRHGTREQRLVTSSTCLTSTVPPGHRSTRNSRVPANTWSPPTLPCPCVRVGVDLRGALAAIAAWGMTADLDSGPPMSRSPPAAAPAAGGLSVATTRAGRVERSADGILGFGHPWQAGQVSGAIRIRGTLWIPAAELAWRFSRSSGPGGQGVNTWDSRVELLFDLASSPSIPPVLKARAIERLGPRLQDGVLVVVASGATAWLRAGDCARSSRPR